MLAWLRAAQNPPPSISLNSVSSPGSPELEELDDELVEEVPLDVLVLEELLLELEPLELEPLELELEAPPDELDELLLVLPPPEELLEELETSPLELEELEELELLLEASPLELEFELELELEDELPAWPELDVEDPEEVVPDDDPVGDPLLEHPCNAKAPVANNIRARFFKVILLYYLYIFKNGAALEFPVIEDNP